MALKKITEKSFKDITKHTLEETSYLNLFNILRDSDNNYFLNIFRSYKINEDLLLDILYYITYEIQDTDWFDSIAYKYYNEPKLWWLTLITNNIMNPFEEMEPGKNIKILRSTLIPRVYSEIKEIMKK